MLNNEALVLFVPYSVSPFIFLDNGCEILKLFGTPLPVFKGDVVINRCFLVEGKGVLRNKERLQRMDIVFAGSLVRQLLLPLCVEP